MMAKLMRSDEELIELLWQDGHVIMHKQACKRGSENDELVRDSQYRCARSHERTSGLILEDETEPWIPYNVDESLERGLCSELFKGVPSTVQIDANGFGNNDAAKERGLLRIIPSKDTNNTTFQNIPKQHTNNYNFASMRSQFTARETYADRIGANVFVNSPSPSAHMKMVTRPEDRQLNQRIQGDSTRKDLGQPSSMMSKMSSNCSSNHFVIPREHPQSLRKNTLCSREFTNAEMTSMPVQAHNPSLSLTSSSGGSGSIIGKTIQPSCNKERQKRKQMESEDAEFYSEVQEGDDYSIEPSKQQQRSMTSTRRSRSAEIHNLSERKRRDRINEKLKALQDLIPNCSKTDKASVLDEAIEYLKSLQLQLQFMWMGSGMARMMIPNLQHYFSSLNMGMAHGSSMAPFPGPIQIPAAAPMFNNPTTPENQARSCAFPTTGHVDDPHRMQNFDMSDVYARHIGIQQMQPASQLTPPAVGEVP